MRDLAGIGQVAEAVKPVTEAVAKSKTFQTIDEICADTLAIVKVATFLPSLAGKAADNIRDFYINKLNSKLITIPEDKFQDIPEKLIYETSEKIKFETSEDIKDIFANLLAKSANRDYNNILHPSFFEIVKSFSIEDALFCKKIIDDNLYLTTLPIIKTRLDIEGHYIDNGFVFNFDINGNFRFSIENLIRNGLITEDYNRALSDDRRYNDLIDEFTSYYNSKIFYKILNKDLSIFQEVITYENFIKLNNIDDIKCLFKYKPVNKKGILEFTTIGENFFKSLKGC